jgi:hypothetical protein
MLQRVVAIPAAVDAFVVVLDPWISVDWLRFRFLLASRRHFRPAVAVQQYQYFQPQSQSWSRSLPLMLQ